MRLNQILKDRTMATNKATQTGKSGTIKGNWRDKELIRSIQVFDLEALDYNNRPKRVIDCRLYMGRSNNSSTIYCLLWISPIDGTWVAGSGSVGGYGYEKQSAAIGDAIMDAGITLEHSVSGVGMEAANSGLEAIAEYSGSNKLLVVESYA
jgi:hypothetical protein